MSAVILSLCYQYDKLGAAYYDEENAKIYVHRDVTEDSQFRAVQLRNFFCN